MGGGCNQLDITCICSDSELISGLACCVSKECDTADQDKTIQFAQNLCGGEGVDNLPTSATCASTASTGASSMGSSSASASAAEQTDNAGARSAEGGLGLGMLVAGLVAALEEERPLWQNFVSA